MPSIYLAVGAGLAGLLAFTDPTGLAALFAVFLGFTGFILGMWGGILRKPFLALRGIAEAFETVAVVWSLPGKKGAPPLLEVRFRRARLLSVSPPFGTAGSRKGGAGPGGGLRPGLNHLTLVSGGVKSERPDHRLALLISANGRNLLTPEQTPVWLRWENTQVSTAPRGRRRGLPGKLLPTGPTISMLVLVVGVLLGTMTGPIPVHGAETVTGQYWKFQGSGPSAISPANPTTRLEGLGGQRERHLSTFPGSELVGRVSVAGRSGSVRVPLSRGAAPWPLYISVPSSPGVGEQLNIIISCGAATGLAIMLVVGTGEVDFGDGSTYSWPSSFEGAFVETYHTYNQGGSFTLTATGTCTDGTYDYPASGTMGVTVGVGTIGALAGVLGLGFGVVGVIPVAGGGGGGAGPVGASAAPYYPDGLLSSQDAGVWGGGEWADPYTMIETSIWQPPVNLPAPPFSAPPPAWMPQLPGPTVRPITEAGADSLMVQSNSEGVVNMAAIISVQGGNPSQPFTYTWRTDDGMTYSIKGGPDSSFTHWFQTPGTHSISVTISQPGVRSIQQTFVQTSGG
jgi:hypothetical protein